MLADEWLDDRYAELSEIDERSPRSRPSTRTPRPEARRARDFRAIIERKGHATDNAREAMERLESALAQGALVRTDELDQALADLRLRSSRDEGQKLGGKSAEAARFITRRISRLLDDAWSPGRRGSVSMFVRGPRVSEEQKKRIPPGQYFTEKWPVLHYGSVPRVDLKTWDFKVWGEVDNPFALTLGRVQGAAAQEAAHRHPLRDALVTPRHGLRGRADPGASSSAHGSSRQRGS